MRGPPPSCAAVCPHAALPLHCGEANMTVSYRTEDQLAIVTIDRPDRRNAVDAATAAALADAFRRFDVDDAAHVAILQGANNTFCAGGWAFLLKTTPTS